ncbi:MAG: hypothetical protein ACYC5V_05660 [Gemmatimonadaceae bacterium]
MPPARGGGLSAVSDTAWAVALVREAAAALFARRADTRFTAQAGPSPAGNGVAHANASRPGLEDRGGRESQPTQPTVR